MVIAGPFSEFFEAEVNMIHKYMSFGGSLMLLADPGPIDIVFSEFLVDWGIQLADDKIIDPYSRLFGAEIFVPIIESYNPEHTITKDFGYYTVFPLVRSVTQMEFKIPGVIGQPLAWTSSRSWGEINPDSAMFDEGLDQPGPRNIAVALEKQRIAPTDAMRDTTLSPARMVVIGDSDFANNVYFYQYGNSDFFMNCLAWLAGEEDLISIRPREMHERRLNITMRQAGMLFWIALIFVPLFVLSGGAFVWWTRR